MKIFGLTITREKRGVEDPKYPLTGSAMLDAMGMSDTSVTPSSAMGVSAVYACVRVIAESLAALPLHVYQRNGATVEKATGHPAYRLLHSQPNNYQTSFQFREVGQSQAALWGNFYAEIIRNGAGIPISLHPLSSSSVTPRFSVVDGERVKTYHVGSVTLRDDQVLHIPALGWDGISGISPISLQRRSIGQAISADEFGEKFYQNGTRLSGVLEHPGKLSEDVQARLKLSWSNVYSGAANAGKVALLEEGMKFNPLMMPLSDAQYIETRKFQVTEIARIFRVPPHMIADLEKATFSNIEQQSLDFVTHSLMPWIVRWEQEINRKLLSGDYFAKFNVAGLLRGDIKSRYEAYNQGRTGGWLSVNDIREFEDLNPIENGDIYLQQMNMIEAGGQPQDGTPTRSKFDDLLRDAGERLARREIDKCPSGDDGKLKFYRDHADYVRKVLSPILRAMGTVEIDSIVTDYVVSAVDDDVNDIEYTSRRIAHLMTIGGNNEV